MLPTQLADARATCSSSQYLSGSGCANITTCTNATQYQAAPPTASTDRSCVPYAINQTALLQLASTTDVSFAPSEAQFVSALQGLLNTTVHVLVFKNANASALNVSFVSVSNSTGTPQLASAFVAELIAANTTACGLDTCLQGAIGYKVTLIVVQPQPSTIPPVQNNTISTVNALSQGTLNVFITLTKLWINLVQPKDLPYATIGDAIHHMFNKTFTVSSSQEQTDALNYAIPLLTMAAFALAMALFFPLILLLICCCRTCRCCCCYTKCGGRRLQYEPQPKCRRFLIFMVLLLSILAILSAAGIIIGDQQLTTGKNSLMLSFNSAIDDVVALKNLTVNQTLAIVDVQYFTMVSNIDSVITDLGAADGNAVQATLKTATNTLIGDLNVLDASVSANLNDLNIIQANTNSIESGITVLNNTLNAFQTNSTTNQQYCLVSVVPTVMPVNQTALQTLCSYYPTSTSYTISVDYSTFPSLTSYVSALNSINSNNFTQQAQAATDQLNKLNTTINDAIANAQSQVDSKLASFHSTLSTQFHTQVDKINTKFDSSFNAASYHAKVNVCTTFIVFSTSYINGRNISRATRRTSATSTRTTPLPPLSVPGCSWALRPWRCWARCWASPARPRSATPACAPQYE